MLKHEHGGILVLVRSKKKGPSGGPSQGGKRPPGSTEIGRGNAGSASPTMGAYLGSPVFPVDEQRNRPAGALVVGQTPRFRTIRRSFRQQYLLHAIAQILRPNFVVWTFYVRPARFYEHTTAGPDC